MSSDCLQVGDVVFYHPIIDEPHDGKRYEIRRIGRIPSSEEPVAWLFGKAGCVLLSALSKAACRECGCTDDDCSGCIERTGRPCSWAETDLCSACEEASE